MQGTGVAETGKRQVITIDVNGGLQSLRKKKGEGIDLRQFGAAVVERVSEILFDETAQKFYVQFLTGMLGGRKLTYTLYTVVTGQPTLFTAGQPVMMFDDYEDAVQAEILVLDTIRANPDKFQGIDLAQFSAIPK